MLAKSSSAHSKIALALRPLLRFMDVSINRWTEDQINRIRASRCAPLANVYEKECRTSHKLDRDADLALEEAIRDEIQHALSSNAL